MDMLEEGPEPRCNLAVDHRNDLPDIVEGVAKPLLGDTDPVLERVLFGRREKALP